jgi:hypothetical protein
VRDAYADVGVWASQTQDVRWATPGMLLICTAGVATSDVDIMIYDNDMITIYDNDRTSNARLASVLQRPRFVWVGSTSVLLLVHCAKFLAPYHGLNNRVKFTSVQLGQFCTGMPLCCSSTAPASSMLLHGQVVCRVLDCWTAVHAGVIALALQ